MDKKNLFYREVFLNKIKKYSTILNIICRKDFSNYNHIIKNFDIIYSQELLIKCISIEEYIKQKKEERYDVIIFDDFFDFRVDSSIIDQIKVNDTIIMFITDVSHNSKTFLYNIFYYINTITSINFNYIHISDLYDILRQNSLRIIDSYRLGSNSGFLIEYETFLVSCIKI